MVAKDSAPPPYTCVHPPTCPIGEKYYVKHKHSSKNALGLVLCASCSVRHLLPFEPHPVRGGGLEAHVARQVLHQRPAARQRDHRVLVAAACGNDSQDNAGC